MYCNVFTLKPTRSMSDGRLFRFLAFLPLGVSRRFFPRFPVLHTVLSLTRGVIVHDSASCTREDSLDERRRPSDAFSCFLFSSLWLRSNQCIWVQETQSAKDTGMTCPKMLPIKSTTTCLQVGPMPLDWPVDPFALLDFSSPDLRCVLKFAATNNNEVLFQLPHVARWRQAALQAPPQMLHRTAGWDGCGPFLSEGM